jgi:cell division protein FtsL
MSAIYPSEYQQSPPPTPEPEKRIARFRNAAIAGVLLILVGASVFSIVKLSSVQASLSHAQQQISAEKSELSAEQQRVSADEQELSSLQSTVNSPPPVPPPDPLNSTYGDMVCSNGGVYDISTGQTITAYYPCTDKNPN